MTYSLHELFGERREKNSCDEHQISSILRQHNVKSAKNNDQTYWKIDKSIYS